MANDLIKLFSIERADPAEHPKQWQAFLDYAAQDIVALRDACRHMRPLPAREWREFHAAEHVNWRGIEVDTLFVDGAARLTAEGVKKAGNELKHLTAGIISSVDQTAAIAAWLFDTLTAAEARTLLHKIDEDEDDIFYEDGTPVARKTRKQRTGKGGRPSLSIDEEHLDSLVAWLQDREKRGIATPEETTALRVALIRRYGSGASPKKFAAIRRRQAGGVLAGQYVFQGASQTGRLSSTQTQIHNLTRDALQNEAATIDAIAEGAGYDNIAALAPAEVPVIRKLGLLVRPVFVAASGKIFIWSDWSAVEARVLPWMSDSVGGRQLLEDFVRVDADPNLPDLYKRTAGLMFGKDPRTVTDEERQAGKIAVLSCGYRGGVGAVQSFAAGYGIYFSDAQARDIVALWREANPWAVVFWDEVWGAYLGAWENPGTITTAGRLAFRYDERYLGGCLFMALPSGRLLSYPRPRWSIRRNKKTGEERRELTIRRATSRVRIWSGTVVENADQGIAADMLRGTLRRLVYDPSLAWMPVRLHTHDEVLVEVDEGRAAEAKVRLHDGMCRGFAWSEGLPLASEETVKKWYTKSKE